MKKNEQFSAARCIKLSSLELDKDNTIEQPVAIVPQESAVAVSGQSLSIELEPYSFAVYILNK